MQCPNCYRELYYSRTPLPDHLADEYLELEKLDSKDAEDFYNDNTEERLECSNCGVID